jgi:hypothetical protein
LGGSGLAFVIGNHCHDADCQPVGLWHVRGHEINTGLLKPEEEMSIAREAIELCDHQFGTDQPTELECLCQFRAVCLLAAFDLDKLLHELPIAAIEEILEGRRSGR